MKKIFHKNQLIITALALMIAVAGYFSYMNNQVEIKTGTDVAGADELQEDYEISDEDVMAEDIFTAEEDPSDGQEVAEVSGTETAENTQTGSDDIDNPGEAVLTGTTVANLDYASEMKLNREQIRSKNKETLLEIVNNATVSDELKQDAIHKMIAMTDIAERENAAEMLLEAKGFTDVVVSITDENCDVVLNMGEVTDAKRAQVEDIVKRKTNIAAENIIITPIAVGENSR